jgi:hypothetical protein
VLVIGARGTLGPFPACAACSGISSQISSVYLPVMQDVGQIQFVNSFGIPSKTCCRKPDTRIEKDGFLWKKKTGLRRGVVVLSYGKAFSEVG